MYKWAETEQDLIYKSCRPGESQDKVLTHVEIF